MNELQKELLIGYLKDKEIDILSVAFLKGGNISNDSLTVHYYCKINGEWHLTTDIIGQDGSVQTTKAKASAR